jgi:hypothetical protein
MTITTTTALRLQLDNIAKLAGTDVASLMALLEAYPQKEWAEIIRTTLPQILETYSMASRDLTADYYNKKRTAIIKDSGDKNVKKFVAGAAKVSYTTGKDKSFHKAVEYHVSRAFTEVPKKIQDDAPEDVPAVADNIPELLPEELAAKRQQIAANLELEMRKQIFQTSRRLIEESSNLDPLELKTRRVLSASGCNFCKLQNLHNETHHGFHKGCKCTVDFGPPDQIDERQEASNASFKDDYALALSRISGPRTDSKIVAELDRMTQERRNEKTN